MKNWKAFLSTFILSYIFWILFLMQDFNILKMGIQELLAGIAVAAVIAFFTSKFFVKEDGFWIFKKFRLLYLLKFIPVYIWELIKANWIVAKTALSKNMNINPAIVKINTEIKSDWGLAMLANCITLTPGTITMDIYEEDDNKNYLYIHWLNAETEDIEKASNSIKGVFEKYIRGIFK